MTIHWAVNAPECLIIILFSGLCPVYVSAAPWPEDAGSERENSESDLTRASAYSQPEIHPKGAINSSDWTLKQDYERMLRDSGWTRQQLASLSVTFDIVYLDQSNIRTTVHSIRPNKHPKKPMKNSGQNDGPYAKICPSSITVRSQEIFGRDEAGRARELNLVLNQYVHTPNLQVKSLSNSGAETRDVNSGEECYYQNREETPFGTSSINSNGQLRAMFQSTEKLLVVEPLHSPAARSSKEWHTGRKEFRVPHLIFVPKASSSVGKENTCGTYVSEKSWRSFRTTRRQMMQRSPRSSSPVRYGTSLPPAFDAPHSRSARDIRLKDKWIEVALIMDSKMVQTIREHHREPIEVAMSLVNLIDQIFGPLKTHVILSYLELWTTNNQMHITSDSSGTLLNLMSYSTQHLYSVPFDTLQLITAGNGGFYDAGTGSVGSACTLKSVGVVHMPGQFLNLLRLATNLAHMIAHNIGIHHDSEEKMDCVCPHEGGCMMNPDLIPASNGHRPLFSSCSQDDFFDALHMGQNVCLLKSPFQEAVISPKCGNAVLDQGEECDCGGFMGCLGKGSCCDPTTCLFKEGAECADGPCCTQECKLKKEGSLCRTAKHDCDLPEYCSGQDSQCPENGFKRNGQYCRSGKSYCFNRTCAVLDDQCAEIWGVGSTVAEMECYRRFNSEGIFNGHCGLNSDETYKICENEDLVCGTVQCQGGHHAPLRPNGYSAYATVITMSGKQLECKTRTSETETVTSEAILEMLAANGTKCDVNKVCLHGKCVDIALFIQKGKCPSNNVAMSCSGHGHCNDLNQCSCDSSFVGTDCSSRPQRFTNGTFQKPGIEVPSSKRTASPVSASTTLNEILDNFMIPMIMTALIIFFLVFFLLALFCYKKTPHVDECHSAYYEETEDTSATCDTSPVSSKPTMLHEMLPLPQYSSLRKKNSSSTQSMSVQEKQSLLSDNVHTRYSNGSVVHGNSHELVYLPRPSLRNNRKDAANSPYIKRRVSSRTNLLVPHVTYVHSTKPEERLSDEWTSVSDEMSLPHDKPLLLLPTPNYETYREVGYSTPHRMASPQFGQGRVKIRNFDQLLRQLDDVAGTSSESTPSVLAGRYGLGVGSSPDRQWSTAGRFEMRDASAQVNLDADRAFLEEDEKVLDIPPPMSELSLTRLMTTMPNHVPRFHGTLPTRLYPGSQNDLSADPYRKPSSGASTPNPHDWRAQRPSSIRSVRQYPLTSPQKRRQLHPRTYKRSSKSSEFFSRFSDSESDIEDKLTFCTVNVHSSPVSFRDEKSSC